MLQAEGRNVRNARMLASLVEMSRPATSLKFEKTLNRAVELQEINYNNYVFETSRFIVFNACRVVDWLLAAQIGARLGTSAIAQTESNANLVCCLAELWQHHVVLL